MNLGKSENNLIQVQKWRAVDKRVSFEPGLPSTCNSCGSPEICDEPGSMANRSFRLSALRGERCADQL
jgi:hypothetical protein